MRSKNKLKQYFLLFGIILLCSILLILISAVRPELFGLRFATSMKTKYHTLESGIYEYDQDLKMNFMKPNFKTVNYWNGYSWIHETDKYGFRNSEDKDRADILLLGDSFIYGHGLDYNKTVGHLLEKDTGLSVMNMARQGDTVYQEMYLLNKYGFNFQPKYVFYFFFLNDVEDIKLLLTEEEMETFMQTPFEDLIFKDKNIIKNDTPTILAKTLNKTVMFINALRDAVGNETNNNYTKTVNMNSPEAQYLERAIVQMKYESDSEGAEFIIVPITLGQHNVFKTLEDIAKSENIPFIDIRSIENLGEHHLPNDGHFSEAGARALVSLLSEYLNQKK